MVVDLERDPTPNSNGAQLMLAKFGGMPIERRFESRHRQQSGTGVSSIAEPPQHNQANSGQHKRIHPGFKADDSVAGFQD
jgi:hypothetical protein